MNGREPASLRAEFEHLASADDAEREQRLRALRESDPALADELASLLEHAERPRVDLDTPVETQLVDEALPAEIGPYRIVRRLASGGMGVVFLAEQSNPRRTVALKMLRTELVSPQLVGRFRRESEILGRLQHDGIARIFDAGTWAGPAGELPYFAMEFVEGRTITAYAREQGLNTRARVQLVRRVADAIEHAHQRGVVHRDLKPDNVLVLEDRDSGVGLPKVLDFGVARATDADLQLTTLQTDVGQLIGTLPYMSPEQLEGNPRKVDHRSDVYALGVLLFELLSGQLPHDVRGLGIAEAARRIRDDDPTRLTSIDTQYRGDLETVLGKALEKDRDRRYASAAALSEDLRRFLTNEPIQARPPSTWYQLERFCRRHRVLVASAALVALIGIVAIAGLSLTTLRAKRAEADAEVRFQEANAIAGFYDGVLQTLRSANTGPDATVLEMIDEMAFRLEGDASLQPVVAARLEFTLGSAYRLLGQMPKAARFFEQSYARRQEQLGPEHPETVDTAFELAMSLQATQERERALELLVWARPLLEAQNGLLDHRTIGVLSSIANALDNDPLRREAARDYYEEALSRMEQAGLLRSEQGVITLSNYAVMCIAGEEVGRPETLLLRALEIAGDEIAQVPTLQAEIARGHLGRHYLEQERFDEAEPHLQRAYQTLLDTAGHAHIGTSMTGLQLASAWIQTERSELAEPLLQRCKQALTEQLGAGHRYTLRAWTLEARLLQAQGASALALETLDTALDLAFQVQGEISDWSARLFEERAEVLEDLGRRAPAASARDRAARIRAELEAR